VVPKKTSLASFEELTPPESTHCPATKIRDVMQAHKMFEVPSCPIKAMQCPICQAPAGKLDRLRRKPQKIDN